MLPHLPVTWTSRTGKTLDQLVADATKPKPHPNALPFRQPRSDTAIASELTQATPRERPKIMRGMQRLANLAPTIMASLDAKADAVADKLVAQNARAESAIDQYDGLANSLGQVADTVTAALGQITNDPTQVSGGSTV